MATEERPNQKTERTTWTFPDVPLAGDASASDDNCLGLKEHAGALAEFVAGCETPMTIGLQGDWGTGKTSLMRMIRHRLEDQEHPCLHVEFNTWQYSQFSQKDRLPFSMMWNLVAKLKKEADKRKKGWISQQTKSYLVRFARGLGRAATLAAGKLASGSLSGLGMSIDVNELIGSFDDSAERIDEAQLFEDLRADFERIVAAAVGSLADSDDSLGKVVFYIDDLDRLEPARAVELLEVIKNFLDVSGCIFVLAIDYDVIIRGLRDRHWTGSDDGGYGKSFFDKIIQLPYRMPSHGYEAWKLFMQRSQVFYQTHNHKMQNGTVFKIASPSSANDVSKKEELRVLDNTKSLILNSTGRNPRAVKRLLNLCSLAAKLERVFNKNRMISGPTIDLLIVITALQMSHDRLYRFLARNSHLGEGGPIALCFLNEVLDAVESQHAEEGEDEEFEALVREILRAAAEEPSRLAGRSFRDPETLQYLAAAVAELVRDFTERPLPSEETLLHWRRTAPELAKLLVMCLDYDLKQSCISSEERLTYTRVLAHSAVTGFDGSDAPRTRPKAGDSRIRFFDLREKGLICGDEPLVFRIPGVPEQSTPRLEVRPSFRQDTWIFSVELDGKAMSLSAATRAVVEKLGPHAPEVTGNSARYWIAKRPNAAGSCSEMRLDQLLSTYRTLVEAKREEQQEQALKAPLDVGESQNGPSGA